MAFLQGSTKEHTGHLFSVVVGRSWRERGASVTVNPNKPDCSSKEDRNAVKAENEKNTLHNEIRFKIAFVTLYRNHS